jgi:hypothetical protein
MVDDKAAATAKTAKKIAKPETIMQCTSCFFSPAVQKQQPLPPTQLPTPPLSSDKATPTPPPSALTLPQGSPQPPAPIVPTPSDDGNSATTAADSSAKCDKSTQDTKEEHPSVIDSLLAPENTTLYGHIGMAYAIM